MSEIPNPVTECDGCGKEMNLLAPFLVVTVKPQHQALLVEDVPAENEGEISKQNITLGTRKGRGVAWKFHNFDCAIKKISTYKGKEPKLEVHAEKEIYVPEDNRSPEELVKAGEITKEQYAVIDREPAPQGGEE